MPFTAGTTPDADGGFGTSGMGRGLVGHSTGQAGVVGDSDNFHGVFGVCHKNPNGAGVFGTNDVGGFGVQGVTVDGTGVLGSSTNGEGVHGETTGAVAGVAGFNHGAEGRGAAGVFGHSDFGEGVHGEATANVAGVAGFNLATQVPEGMGGIFPGVFGRSEISEGVHGESNGTAAVVGLSLSKNCDGVLGICERGGNAIHGIGGTATEPAGPGFFANSAGLFEGGVIIEGNLNVIETDFGGKITATTIIASEKQFVIDHPCEPADKYLQHSSVESFEMMNLYSGNVTTDHNGDATIILPDYFEALNTDFRYHLTVIGQFAQAIVVAEIVNSRFTIKTDKPHVKVSWQVAGIRQDAYARAHPLVVEREKPGHEKGLFLHPQAYGQPEDKGTAWARRAAATCDSASAYRARRLAS